MTIAGCWLGRPDGIVGHAYADAMQVVDEWLRDGNERIWNCIAGAPLVALIEGVAEALLMRCGYDEELLDLAIDETAPEGWTLADVDAELERTRGRA